MLRSYGTHFIGPLEWDYSIKITANKSVKWKCYKGTIILYLYTLNKKQFITIAVFPTKIWMNV